MIRMITRRGVLKGEGRALNEKIAAALAQKEFLWVDLEAPTPEEAGILSEVFRFHPLSIDDCLHGLQRAKLDEYPGYLFLVLHVVEALILEGKATAVHEFDTFLGPTYLVTFHWQRLEFVEEIYREYAETKELTEKGTGFLLYQILRRLVDTYFPLLDQLEECLAAAEKGVFLSPDQKWLAEAFNLRGVMLRIRRTLSPQREALNALIHRPRPYLKEEDHIYLMDVYDHLLRLFELVDNYHDLLAATLEVYLTSISNRMNEIMKILTIITTIMMPLSVIAGIYGMNFHYMPELRSPYGYPAVLGVMLLISAGMLVFFRRKRWL